MGVYVPPPPTHTHQELLTNWLVIPRSRGDNQWEEDRLQQRVRKKRGRSSSTFSLREQISGNLIVELTPQQLSLSDISRRIQHVVRELRKDFGQHVARGEVR